MVRNRPRVIGIVLSAILLGAVAAPGSPPPVSAAESVAGPAHANLVDTEGKPSVGYRARRAASKAADATEKSLERAQKRAARAQRKSERKYRKASR